MMTYHWFAENYNWTPRQVDQLDLSEVFWLPVIKGALSDAIEEYRDKDN